MLKTQKGEMYTILVVHELSKISQHQISFKCRKAGHSYVLSFFIVMGTCICIDNNIKHVYASAVREVLPYYKTLSDYVLN